jgi:Protein of unknown function (DUF3501)
MQPLSRTDLFALETYAVHRPDFRAQVLAHKRARTLQLGAHVTVLFEDRLTVQYQIQEMLRIERIFEPEAIQRELDVYNPLIPSGSDLRATMLLAYPDHRERLRQLTRLIGIEDRVYVEIAGHGRADAYADEDITRNQRGKTAAVHFLRFVFAPTQIAALRAGAAWFVGIDDARLPQRIEVVGERRDALLRDFA